MQETPLSLLDRLNDPDVFSSLDPQDMLGLVRRFPRQCREAVAIARPQPPVAPNIQPARQVIVSGMGGSAAGGDLARVLMEEYSAVPLTVNRDYTLPRFLDEHALVVCISYSGNTEETLSAYEAAKAAGAQIAVITSGGQLWERAVEDGCPAIEVPGGQPPRSALGFLFFPMIGLLADWKLLPALAEPIGETLDRLDAMERTFGPDTPTERNPAKQLAVALQGKLPVIYGSQGGRGVVAQRWKGQFNENAKQAAFANVLPEQNHNEILAWTGAQKQAQNWAVVFLRDREEPPRIARRVEVTKELLGPETAVHEVWAEGESYLARMLYLVHFADYLTVYLAYLNGVCPTEIAGIDHLKAELAKLG